MQNNDLQSPFIFFLTLEDHLPKSFYKFDALFKEHGYILVPVKVDQLQTLAASSEQNQFIVISSIVDSREFKIYNTRVRGLLKFILKSKRISFLHLSSFSKLNDSQVYNMTKNYFFMKYPLNSKVLVERIVNFYVMKNEKRTIWPGGKRSTAVGSV